MQFDTKVNYKGGVGSNEENVVDLIHMTDMDKTENGLIVISIEDIKSKVSYQT